MDKDVGKAGTLSTRDIARGILNSLVLAASALALLAVSCIAFLLFYHHNVPPTGVHKTIYLQYHDQINPYAVVNLGFSTAELATSQPYDVSVELIVPNTPSNHEIGNFMVDLDMLNTASESIVRSARPAILQYASPMIDTMSTMISSGPILLGLKQESQTIQVPLLEAYEFEAGWLTNPSHARIEIHAPTLKVYACKLSLHTRLRGLPWLLYHFKVPSFILFTTLFWFSSTLFMVGSWAFMSLLVTTPIKRNATLNSICKDAESTPRFDHVRRQGPSTGSFFEFDDREGSVETDATTLVGDETFKI